MNFDRSNIRFDWHCHNRAIHLLLLPYCVACFIESNGCWKPGLLLPLIYHLAVKYVDIVAMMVISDVRGMNLLTLLIRLKKVRFERVQILNLR